MVIAGRLMLMLLVSCCASQRRLVRVSYLAVQSESVDDRIGPMGLDAAAYQQSEFFPFCGFANFTFT